MEPSSDASIWIKLFLAVATALGARELGLYLFRGRRSKAEDRKIEAQASEIEAQATAIREKANSEILTSGTASLMAAQKSMFEQFQVQVTGLRAEIVQLAALNKELIAAEAACKERMLLMEIRLVKVEHRLAEAGLDHPDPGPLGTLEDARRAAQD